MSWTWLRFTKLVSNFMFGKKEMKIMMVGLDGAGKTTITYKLKLGEVVNTNPTVGFEMETIEYNDITFTVWELGGQLRYKLDPLWRHSLPNTNGLIFVVDSIDRDRVAEARDYLHNILTKDELRDVVLLVFANKQDLPNAMTKDEITEKLDLNSIEQHKWYIQSICATSGDGLHEGFDWLCNNMDEISTKNSSSSGATIESCRSVMDI